MLELRNVGYETDDNKEILHDVSLPVQERFVAITGPNGGGKSTLAKVIAGIYQPTTGQILLDGEDITGPVHHRAGHRASAMPSSSRCASRAYASRTC